MPSIETYRKQAKLLVRWHREGNYSVGGKLRQLDRFRDITDREALDAPMPLALAQEIVGARVEFAQGLVKQAWGGTDFHVRDLDGNVISFVQYRRY